MIPLAQATGKLKEMYQRVTTPSGTVENVMRAHSLRPHSMEGHLVLYKNVLHNPENTLPFWFLEVVASYVSMSNRCDYSLTHHFANARRLINDAVRAQAVWDVLSAAQPDQAFSGKELALLRYHVAGGGDGQGRFQRLPRCRLRRRRDPGGQPGLRLFQLLEPVAQRSGCHHRGRHHWVLQAV